MIGVGIGIFYVSSWALGTKIVPKENAGKYLGLSNLAGAGAGAVGAYIGGPIADTLGYIALFILYGSLFIISIVALMNKDTSRILRYLIRVIINYVELIEMEIR